MNIVVLCGAAVGAIEAVVFNTVRGAGGGNTWIVAVALFFCLWEQQVVLSFVRGQRRGHRANLHPYNWKAEQHQPPARMKPCARAILGHDRRQQEDDRLR